MQVSFFASTHNGLYIYLIINIYKLIYFNKIAKSIKQRLIKMINKWGITKKIHLVVRDNASANRVAFPSYKTD